ncbi:unnamed protein product [Phytophthora lilii]|uniref:Unnamed protein product n=1 Tax=Phytophthora lilii TaxID=2077276 RepID=A0A9W6YJ83_9STRA|nr:unnamed protein product [Phytophthora lilii]
MDALLKTLYYEPKPPQTAVVVTKLADPTSRRGRSSEQPLGHVKHSREDSTERTRGRDSLTTTHVNENFQPSSSTQSRLPPKVDLTEAMEMDQSMAELREFAQQLLKEEALEGKGKRPILTAININSRLGYAKLLRNKTTATVLAALKVFVRLHKVDILTSDNGSEFMTLQAQELFKSKAIEHYNNEPGDHGTMGKIERFNRTLKQRLTKMSPKRITQKLITDVIENYNTTLHRSIGMTPNEAKGKVMDADLSHNQVEADRIEKEFDVGSSVLYRLKKQAFDKESARWSKAVYKIVGIDGYRVQIRSRNGHTLYKAPNDLKWLKQRLQMLLLIVAIFLKLRRSWIIRRHGLGSTNI